MAPPPSTLRPPPGRQPSALASTVTAPVVAPAEETTVSAAPSLAEVALAEIRGDSWQPLPGCDARDDGTSKIVSLRLMAMGRPSYRPQGPPDAELLYALREALAGCPAHRRRLELERKVEEARKALKEAHDAYVEAQTRGVDGDALDPFMGAWIRTDAASRQAYLDMEQAKATEATELHKAILAVVAGQACYMPNEQTLLRELCERAADILDKLCAARRLQFDAAGVQKSLAERIRRLAAEVVKETIGEPTAPPAK